MAEQKHSIKGQTKVNARLLAAAPDMLEALETACDELCRQSFSTDDQTGVNYAIDKARAAIAKAKGEGK